MRKILYEYYIQCRVDVGIIFVVFVNIYNVCVHNVYGLNFRLFGICFTFAVGLCHLTS